MENKHKTLTELLQRWQKIEDASVQSTTDVINSTMNPLIHIVMEIIRQDSAMHRRVQQIIIDNLAGRDFSVSSSEISELWDLLNEHDEMEKKTIDLAEEALSEVDTPIVKYMLEYLLLDEKKHEKLIEGLEKLK